MEPLHSVTKKNDQIAKALNKKNHKLKIDSQCKYTIVSRGQADAAVSDADGKDLNFSDGEGMLGNKGIVCPSSSYHCQIIDAIKELRLNQ